MSLVNALRRVAQTIWKSLSVGARRPEEPVEPPTVTAGVEAPPSPEEERHRPPSEQVGPEETKEAPEDDLTAIRGIGLATQQRLNAIGIKSYAQLADAKPEELREAVGDIGRFAKIDDWIRQARELAAKPR